MTFSFFYHKIGKRGKKRHETLIIFFERLFLELGVEGMANLSRYFSIAKKISKELKRESEQNA